MRRLKKYIFVLLLLAPFPTLASKQVFIGATCVIVSNTGTSDTTVDECSAASVPPTNRGLVMPTAGTIQNLFVAATTTVSTGSYKVAVLKNNATTVLACTITNGSSSCADAVHTVSVAAGDILIASSTALTNPSTKIGITLAVDFVPTVANETVVSAKLLEGGSLTLNGYAPYMMARNTSNSPVTIESSTTQVWFPEGGTMDHMYGAVQTAPTTGVVTVRDNQATSTLSLNFGGLNTVNDLAHALSVATYDYLGLVWQNFSGSADVVNLSARYVPITPGDFIFLGGSRFALDSQTLTTYMAVSGAYNVAANTNESIVQEVTNAFTMTRMQVSLNTAPGTGASRTFTLRRNGANTTLACTIAGTDETCTATGSVVLSQGDFIDTSDTPVASPATGKPAVSYVGNVSPPSPTKPPKTNTKNQFFTGFIKLLGGFFRIR